MSAVHKQQSSFVHLSLEKNSLLYEVMVALL